MTSVVPPWRPLGEFPSYGPLGEARYHAHRVIWSSFRVPVQSEILHWGDPLWLNYHKTVTRITWNTFLRCWKQASLVYSQLDAGRSIIPLLPSPSWSKPNFLRMWGHQCVLYAFPEVLIASCDKYIPFGNTIDHSLKTAAKLVTDATAGWMGWGMGWSLKLAVIVTPAC